MLESSLVSSSRWRRVLTADQALLVHITRLRAPRLTPVMLALTRIGDTESWCLMGVFLLAVHDWLAAACLGLGALGATVPVQILKRCLRRDRPGKAITGLHPLDPDPDAFSFPSGHTASAFGVALSFLAAGHPLAAPALVLASGIGLSRVYLGAHYPLDVGVGVLLGGFGALASRLVLG